MEESDNKKLARLSEENFKLKAEFDELKNLKKKQDKILDSLKESEEKYKNLYENTPVPYQSLNEDGSFIDVNSAWLDTLGFKRGEVIGKFYKDFLHPENKSHFEENFPKFKQRGCVHNVQFKIQHKSGHYIDVSFEGCIGYNSDGSFKQTYCVFHDITDLKKVQEKLYQSKEQLDLALTGAEAGLWWWNIKTGEDYLDERWCAIFGYEREEVKQDVSSWERMMHPDDKDKIMDVITRHLEDEKVEYKHEYRMKCKNGEWKWILALGKVSKRDADGNPLIMSGIIIDVNKQKLAHEELIKYRKKLEETVKERTKKLEEKNKKLDETMKVFVGRELYVKQLEEKVKTLERN